MSMKKLLYILAAVLVAAACEKGPEFVENNELGCEYPRIEVGTEAGSHVFKVLCDGAGTVSIPAGSEWISLSGMSERSFNFSGDVSVAVDYETNGGEERKAVVNIVSGNRSLALEIVQDAAMGKFFYFPQRNFLAAFETGSYSVPFINDYEAPLGYSVSYDEEEGWIEEPLPGILDNELVFSVRENLAQTRRGAIITLTSEDAVGRPLLTRLYVSQMANGEVETIPVTVADVLNFGIDDLDGDGCIRRNYVLRGRVLNDNSEGNGAANQNYSVILQDKTLSGRSVYLQSLEPDEYGQYCGLQVQFKSEEDNSTQRYDILEINLKGLKFDAAGSPLEDTPYHVILSGAGVVNIISTTAGTEADIPEIHRTIASLSDQDIYTYVTIDNCELAIRKGPFCPLDLRYQNICNKYPMVMRDAQGSIMYLVSNNSCAWARDGKGLPEGSGPVSGIVVHERCDNFEWDSELESQSTLLADYLTDVGYIGRFQIRPVTRAEIGISSSLDDASTKLVTEFRYYNANYPDKMVLTAQSDTLYPSWPPVEEPVGNPEVNGYLMYSNGAIATGQDWTHLGPVSGGRITDIPGTNGVFDALGRSIHWSPLSYVNTCGIIQGANGSSWHGGTWYSSSASLSSYYWEIAFSTEGLDASNAPLVLNLGVSSAYGEDNGAPRYWMLAYSSDKKNWTTVTAGDYAAEEWVDYTVKGDDYTYTIPDFPIISSQKQYNLPGNKYISVNFPSSADVWGKQTLYLHLYPAKNLSGDRSASVGLSYDAAPIRNSRRSALNYVGVRCKK